MGRRDKKRRSARRSLVQTDPFEEHLLQISRKKKDHGYGSLVRRTVFFQFRLAADGLRDLLLSPICVIAALLGLLRPDNPSWALDRLMKFGRSSDRWINLFEQEDHCMSQEKNPTIDDLFNHVEREVKTRMDPHASPEDIRWASQFSAAARNKRPNI
ncbi:hypothetical protein [Cohaesibacter celericrescens]|uniref:Uncharacterized protein n=1 Tax=Cohaesibacter celericrescens TaxID=2067669 RepID=A0A2N5XSQ9_9HYPH|nr:hypothetical protein [Cohaesibacter celericrescens]PLW77448.1 hypothetical protein C0081_08960 [Cohaesibacter celericrescens]